MSVTMDRCIILVGLLLLCWACSDDGPTGGKKRMTFIDRPVGAAAEAPPQEGK